MCGIGSDWTSVYPNIKQSLTAPTTTQQSFSKIKTSIQSSTIQPTLTNLPVSSTNLPVSTTNLPVSSTINLSNLPPAAPMNPGAKLGVCNGGFSVYPNTNISICNKDSLGSTRQASEVLLIFLIF